MRNKQIIAIVVGGRVQCVSQIPRGVEVVVRNYDLAQVDPAAGGGQMKSDFAGKPYLENVFVNDRKEREAANGQSPVHSANEVL